MTFLERYKAGEFEEVWKELMDLGVEVREEPYYSDAWSVAQETMRRVKHNIALLSEILPSLGYVFERPDESFVAPSSSIEDYIQSVESQIGPIPLSIKAFALIVGSIDFSLKQAYLYPNFEGDGDFPQLPLSILRKLGNCDPLVVYPFTIYPEEEFEYLADFSESGEIEWSISPCRLHKSIYSGGPDYAYLMPDPNADAILFTYYDENETFVKFLRESFKNGGFRGYADISYKDGVDELVYEEFPQHDKLKSLTEGLLPI